MATMLGSLLVSLGLQSTQFKRGIREAKQDVDGFSKFAKVGLAAVAAGATAAAGAFAIMVKNSLVATAEIGKVSRAVGVSTEEFQRAAFAAKTVNIETEKLGDIFKDVSDKFGEFFQTGSGQLVDFFENIAPKVGVTAEQFRNLSGPQALQLYVSSLEKAGVSSQEMIFYLEALANDASRLAPLLANNGAEFNRLGDEAERLGLIMDGQTIRAAQAFQENMMRLQGVTEGLANMVAARLLPHLLDFTDWLIRNQMQIVQAVEGFANFISGVGRMASAVARGVAWMEERFGSLARAIGIAIGPLNTLVNLTMRLGGGGGGSGGPIGQTAMGMQSLASQAIAMGKAMGGAEVSTNRAAGAISKAGSAAGVAKDEFADLMEALYPENITRRQREMAANVTRFADQISNPFEARLRALGASGPATLSSGLLTEGSLVDEGAIKGAAEKIKQEMAGLADKTQTQTVRVAESFAQMSQQIIGSLQGLAGSIRSGDFLGILGGVLNIFTQLGSVGAFGKGIQGNLNKPVSAFASGTNSAPGGLSLVGERGPELVNLPRGSGVMTNRELRNLGGTSVQVIPSPYFDVVVDGRIVQSAPAVANAGAMQAQAMGARSARRRVR